MATTGNWLECPVCEYRFSVPPEYLDKSGKCPKCDSVFEASECQLPEKANIVEEELNVPLPAILSEALSSPTPPDQPPIDTSANSKPSSRNDIEGFDHSFIPADKKKTDPNKVLLWVSGSCILAIALLIGIPAIAIWMRGNPDEGPSSNSGGATAVAQQTDSKNNGNPKQTKGNKKRGKGNKNRRKGKKNNKPKNKLEDFTAEEKASLWSTCYSGIALINAKFGDENRTSHGVVVSKDGKIATSLSNVAGADLVRVRLADQEYLGEQRWSKPIIANMISSSRRNLDLAIIKIDESTVPVKSRSTPINNAERGVIPVLSNKKSEDFWRQTRLKPAKPFEDLNQVEKETIANLNLVPEGNDYFIVHSARLNRSGLGAPVFDAEGNFVGMHVAHSEADKSSFLIPPASIRKVLNDPIARPIPIGSRAAAKLVSTGATDAAPEPADFESAMDALDEAKWKISSPENYRMAQLFALKWLGLVEEYQTADFTRRLKIEELEKDRKARMKKLLYWPLKEEAKIVSQHSIQAFRNREKGWVGLVTVLKPAGLATDIGGEAAILVEIAESGEKALLVPGEVEGPFLQGSKWIVFAHNQDNTRINTADGKCMVFHVVGVQEK